MFAASPQPQPSIPTKSTDDVIKNVELATFMADVIEASNQSIIVVDFWAPWCEPCKQLGPILEKLIRSYNRTFRLAKIDIDKNPEIAQQLGVQSIPAVFAFFKGRPVDGFMGALPESQIKTWLERLLKATGVKPEPQEETFEEALKYASDFVAENNFAAAEEVYTEILVTNPEHPEAYAGLIRCFIAMGAIPEAEALLQKASEKLLKNKIFDSVRAALDLAVQTKQIQPTAELEKKIQQNPKDYQARFDLAMTCYAAGQKQEAVDHLLDIVKLNRAWNEDAARKQLVKFFEAFGAMDPITIAARKRLSSLLFS